MPITPLHISRNFILKTAGLTAAAMLSLVTAPRIFSHGEKDDMFVASDTLVTPSGLSADSVMVAYPSPVINVAGEILNAKIVVDLNKNILYKYDDDGNPQKAYLIASGKKSTPTDPCLKRVTHIEKYPYSTAPEFSKRRQAPRDYGPRVICLEIIDPETGKVTGVNGEFIHGNNNTSSLGKHVSLGCIRMDNEAVKELALMVKRGDYVVFSKD